MNHVGPAVFLAQPVVDRARIEENKPPLASGICRLQEAWPPASPSRSARYRYRRASAPRQRDRPRLSVRSLGARTTDSGTCRSCCCRRWQVARRRSRHWRPAFRRAKLSSVLSALPRYPILILNPLAAGTAGIAANKKVATHNARITASLPSSPPLLTLYDTWNYRPFHLLSADRLKARRGTTGRQHHAQPLENRNRSAACRRSWPAPTLPSRKLRSSTSSSSIQASKAQHTVRAPTSRRALPSLGDQLRDDWRNRGELRWSILPQLRQRRTAPIYGPAAAATRSSRAKLGPIFRSLDGSKKSPI